MFTTTFAATLFYVLSYPPYLLMRYEKPGPVTIGVMGAHYDFDDEYFAQSNHTFYAPVEWLIDHTPLEKSMTAWATVWTVSDKVQRDSLHRFIDRMPKLQEFKAQVPEREPVESVDH